MARSNPKIKVANVIVDLSMGGIEKTTLNLCANLDPDVFDPVVVCISGGGPLEEEARALDVPTEITGVPVRNLPKAVWALKKTFAKLRPDVIHGNPGMIARLAAPRGVPVISTYHNTLVGRNELSRAIDRMLAKRSVYIVAVSEYILHSTARSIGLVPEAIPVIYNGIDTERIRRMAQSETPLLPLGEPSAVFIGRHVRVKGGDILLRAWAQVQEKFPDAVLYMIGDGEEKSNWENAALAEGLNVHFAGQLSNPYPILQSANVMVMPSRREGLPLTFVEGLTLGIPCVAAAVGGIPEAAVDAAILIEPENADEYANAIIKLFDDNNLRARYSGLARERARRFTVQRMAESYGELYLKALRVK